MKILFISDTHGHHRQLQIEEGTDMIIHSGDASNPKNPVSNSKYMIDFLTWYDELDVKYKIFVAGNHDTSIEAKLINPKDYKNIIYLEHESIELEGIKIFGSPYTPRFYDWAFNVDRGIKINNYWSKIPSDTDILITHGPPKGILDVATKYRDNSLEYCGCEDLYRTILKIKPKINSFGHIHNNDQNINAGTRTVNNLRTLFINASCVTDGRLGDGLTSHGIYVNY